MFGEGHAFRAGTISGVKDKIAYGYVRSYCEANGINAGKDEMDRMVQGCTGVKKTTGQHPGGIVIVPKENDIMEFTPVQYPADRSEGDTATTHFDFHAMDDRLVKLDILGHDDPTVLRMLKDITGLDPQTIPLDDPETMKIFRTSEPLGVTLDELDCDVGSINTRIQHHLRAADAQRHAYYGGRGHSGYPPLPRYRRMAGQRSGAGIERYGDAVAGNMSPETI